MVNSRQSDSARSYRLYRYLLGRLAIHRKLDGTPNSVQTALRVGSRGLRKVLSAVLSDEEAWHKAISSHKKYAEVTTGRVVDMLGTLQENLIEDYKSHDEPYSRVLTAEDILIALYQLIELTPEERSRLGLPVGDRLTLLQQTLLSLQTKSSTENYEAVFRAYTEAVGLEFFDADSAVTNLDQVNELIETSVRAALGYLPQRSSKFQNQQKDQSNEETIIDLTRKAQREVRRLLVRSGNTQPFLRDRAADHPYISHYLQPAFIKKLSQTVVNNERLTAQLPVYLKQLTIETCGPLPFSDASPGRHKFGSSYPPLLNKWLQELDGSIEHFLVGDIPSPSDYELAAQEAIKITLGFYIKVPSDYLSVVPKTFDSLASDVVESNPPYRRVDFTFSSTGIGGTLSHIVKVINTTLLSDIPCLDSFFPIAHDVTSTQTIIRDNVPSPIWAHSLIKLCHNQSVGKALWSYKEDDSSYDDFSFGEPIGHGDFCGFDFLIAQAQSSLQARLQAIRNAGINPQDYIQQLCAKIERQITLKRAWQMLKYYPFSSMAMIGTIHKSILGSTFKNRKLCREDPDIYFDAFLSITEALLDEGAYKASYNNLKKLDVVEGFARDSLAPQGSSDIGSDRCEVFSSTLIIRYLICKATYYYLYDLEESDPKYLGDEFSSSVSRQQLVEKAWQMLNFAEEHIKARLKKYMVISEVSQGTFKPHYQLLGRIYLVRARLLTFFPRLVPRSEEVLLTENFVGQQRTRASVHWGKLYLLEKARLYVAADGSSEAYSHYAALQSCYYITAAYEDPQHLTLSDGRTGESRTLNRDHCLTWAKRLRDHALLTYDKTGRQCYNAIKEKSGLPDEFEDHGRYSIEKLPAIFEDRGLQKGREISEDNQFLTLDISLLAINYEDLPKLTSEHPTKSIYLFGVNTCHLFLARGLYLLCSDTTEEFEKDDAPGPIQWDTKLIMAWRLFDMAWAIAEDGCSIEREKGTKQKKITRSFKSDQAATQYTSREIDSVRDLYPRRVNEIADIGKIFSAACMVLRLYTLPASERAPITQNIDKIFDMLHGEYRLAEKPLLKVLLTRQKRYNGHLEDFLANARSVVESHKPASENAYPDDAVETARNTLMTELFSALFQEN
ncbi:MAG: hypothetical protein WBC73_06490 [Phormidesmis sp.]